MKVPVPDPDELEKDKIKFLEAIYTMAKEANQDATRIAPKADVIGERCGFDSARNRRIHSDLKEEGLITYYASGPLCKLTTEGRDAIEEHLFNKSAKGRVRAITTKSKELAKSGASKGLVYLGGLISGWISAAGAIYFRPILDAVLKWIGVKH